MFSLATSSVASKVKVLLQQNLSSENLQVVQESNKILKFNVSGMFVSYFFYYYLNLYFILVILSNLLCLVLKDT